MRSLDIVLLALASIIAALYIYAFLSGSVELWILFSFLGAEYIYVALSALIYCFSPRLGYILLSSLLLSANLNVLLKNVVAEPRPPRYMWKVSASGYSFPSGHSQVSSTFWYTLSLLFRRASLLVLATVLVTSIATSRVMLGVHWVQDVVGGVAIGLALSWLTAWLYHRVTHAELLILIAALILGAATLGTYGITANVHLPAIIFSTVGTLAAYPLYVKTRPTVESSTAKIKTLRAIAVALTSLTLVFLFKKMLTKPYSDTVYLVLPTIIVTLSSAIREKHKKTTQGVETR